MEMVTVWNWKQVRKAAAILLAVSVAWGLIAWAASIAQPYAALIGLAIGMATGAILVATMDLFRFEYRPTPR